MCSSNNVGRLTLVIDHVYNSYMMHHIIHKCPTLEVFDASCSRTLSGCSKLRLQMETSSSKHQLDAGVRVLIKMYTKAGSLLVLFLKYLKAAPTSSHLILKSGSAAAAGECNLLLLLSVNIYEHIYFFRSVEINQTLYNVRQYCGS